MVGLASVIRSRVLELGGYNRGCYTIDNQGFSRGTSVSSRRSILPNDLTLATSVQVEDTEEDVEVDEESFRSVIETVGLKYTSTSMRSVICIPYV